MGQRARRSVVPAVGGSMGVHTVWLCHVSVRSLGKTQPGWLASK